MTSLPTVDAVRPVDATKPVDVLLIDLTRPGATAPSRPDFASRSVARHLARGALGFGLIIGSVALVPVAGPATLLAAPLALIAFRGCPTCWMVGLAQTISRGRLERRCEDGVCTLAKAHPHPAGTPGA
ncbi:hypothetical protein ACFCZV_12140 [Streptomyces hydrogenans]|uniref:hypothetical protein n=1 Tax=Streptomyces hydrogenans TaxID=1873719 RepID=UPI0035DF2420